MSKTIPIFASAVREGDVLSFTSPPTRVTVDRLTVAADGRIGIHGNDATWTSTGWAPNELVHVVRDSRPPTVLTEAVQQLRMRTARGEEFPDAEWAVARMMGVSCDALRAAYDEACSR